MNILISHLIGFMAEALYIAICNHKLLFYSFYYFFHYILISFIIIKAQACLLLAEKFSGQKCMASKSIYDFTVF